MHNVTFLDEPVWLKNFPVAQYKRYQAHRLSGLSEKQVNQFFVGVEQDDTTFLSGKAKPTQSYNRRTTKSERAVFKFHTKIIESLEQYLSPIYSLDQNNISIEIQKFNGCIADLVTLNKDWSISIFEVKTNLNCRRNIREAIGQLLDYATHSKKHQIQKLVIVGPTELKGNDLNFFKELNSKIEYTLEYLYFTGSKENPFIKYG